MAESIIECEKDGINLKSLTDIDEFWADNALLSPVNGGVFFDFGLVGGFFV